MFAYLGNYLLYLETVIVDYIDVHFTLWLTWVLTPLLITFLLPGLILLLLYLNALVLYIYKLHRTRIRNAYETDFWAGALHTVAAIWDAHGWIWHGYDVSGFENIPEDSVAMIVFYHGALPIDIYYLIARTLLFKKRLIHIVADRFVFKIPGWKILLDAIKAIPGTIQTCSSVLKQNNLLAIAPGGVYESQFSNSYQLMWKKRVGFAKVALDAKVPIIPVFTQNIRESFRSVTWGQSIWMKLYSIHKFPIVPVYGGFPVKLRTHIGKPIPYHPELTPELLKLKTAHALEELIEEHQQMPGSIFRGLLERFYMLPKIKPE